MMLTEWKGAQLIPINEDATLSTGDRVVIRFQWRIEGTWLRAYELGQIERRFEGRSDWRIISERTEGDYLDVEIEVLRSSAEMAGSIFQASLAPAVWAVVTVAGIGLAWATARYAVQLQQGYIILRKIEGVREGTLPASVLEPSATALETVKWPIAAVIALALYLWLK